MKAARRTQLICAVALFSLSILHAKDLADYRIGDIAEENITATVPLDVIDAEATTARRTIEMQKTPVIFRGFPRVADSLTEKFNSAFAATRVAFTTAAKQTFNPTNAAILDEKTISSSGFERFVGDFNQQNKNIPVSIEIARQWAAGDSATAIQSKYLDALIAAANRPIRPDDLPAGFILSETSRLVPVDDAAEKMTLAEAEQRGSLITQSSMNTLAQARSRFRRDFPQDQSNLSRSLAEFLQPNCTVDANLTRQARAQSVLQLAVAVHYDTGQVIVRRDELVDAKIKAALAQLDDKLTPGKLNQQLAAERDRAQQQQLQAQQARDNAREEHTKAQQEQNKAKQADSQARLERQKTLDLQNQTLKISERNEWLVVALAGISMVSALALWGWIRSRRAAVSLMLPKENLPEKTQLVVPPQFAPQLSQLLKEAVVQGLASQRHELLQAQQMAAAEINDLVRRLDTLQTPLHERVRSYEMRIGELEKELAVRTEENRELLELKIEMMRQQLEAERNPQRAKFN